MDGSRYDRFRFTFVMREERWSKGKSSSASCESFAVSRLSVEQLSANNDPRLFYRATRSMRSRCHQSRLQHNMHMMLSASCLSWLILATLCENYVAKIGIEMELMPFSTSILALILQQHNYIPITYTTRLTAVWRVKNQG